MHTKEENTDNHADNEEGSVWNYVPDSILLHIFQYLPARELLDIGLTCKTWHRVSLDEFLWKDLVFTDYKIEPSIRIAPDKTSWLMEYKRLTYHIPIVQTENLKTHSDEVLHVSFAHNGKMFATCSKDKYVRVWNSSYPASIKYHHDMKVFSWKYTQFSQFNQSDTLLLVLGVHFGTPHSFSGEIAVFSLQGSFALQFRVKIKPYDVFGTWFSDQHLLSGDLHWPAHQTSTSVLWLNKASQETTSKHVPIMSQLYRFYNCNDNYIRNIMIANCLASSPCDVDATEDVSKSDPQPSCSETRNPLPHKDINKPLESQVENIDDAPEMLQQESSRLQANILEGAFHNWQHLEDGMEYACPIQYNAAYRQVEAQGREKDLQEDSDEENYESSDAGSIAQDDQDSVSLEISADGGDNVSEPDDLSGLPEKYLIFTTGSKTDVPHQIGFKRIKSVSFPRRMDPGPSLKERIAQRAREEEREKQNPDAPRPEPNEVVADKFDKIDHLIDLHGRIIGMGLSPDHRYLYVNTRHWPRGYVLKNPFDPPPIAEEIDMHVIDLVTLKEVGTIFRSHKAYTPNDDAFFIFLDVCNEYVASGAEDKHGYLWDRHYGTCLAKFPHVDVVNSVAFNPCDPEMLVTTSDDFTIKVWRSRNRVKELELDSDNLTRGLEIPHRRKKRPSCS